MPKTETGVPPGVITMWSGSVANIPGGWALCDGNNGTPDLTGKFIVHADADSGGSYNPGDTGGQNGMPSHTHTVETRSAGGGSAGAAYAASTTKVEDVATSSIGSGGTADDNRPPYYALCYIMKT